MSEWLVQLRYYVQDKPTEDGKPWTRFVFNNDALLEEEGAAPSSPGADDSKQAGLGAFDFRPHRSTKPQDSGRTAEQAHEVSMLCYMPFQSMHLLLCTKYGGGELNILCYLGIVAFSQQTHYCPSALTECRLAP